MRSSLALVCGDVLIVVLRLGAHHGVVRAHVIFSSISVILVYCV